MQPKTDQIAYKYAFKGHGLFLLHVKKEVKPVKTMYKQNNVKAIPSLKYI